VGTTSFSRMDSKDGLNDDDLWFPGPQFRPDQHVGISGIGVIFTDMDRPRTAGICVSGGSPETYFASAEAGDGNLTFIGLRFDDGTRFNAASIFAGNVELSPFNADGECRGPRPGRPGAGFCGQITDVIAISKIIFAEPVPEPSVLSLLAIGLTGAGVFRLWKRRLR